MTKSEKTSSAPTTALEKLSRRAFLSGAGAAGVATAAAAVGAPLAAHASELATRDTTVAEASPVPGTLPITLKVNGQIHRVQVDPRATVLDTLRETLHLTGTKKGCDHGQCGACTIHLDGRRANSCLLFATMQQNAEITQLKGWAAQRRCIPCRLRLWSTTAINAAIAPPDRSCRPRP